MTVKLSPFAVPREVLAQTGRVVIDGMEYCPKYRLEEVDADELSELCHEFRRNVFKLAKKTDPLGVGGGVIVNDVTQMGQYDSAKVMTGVYGKPTIAIPGGGTGGGIQ